MGKPELRLVTTSVDGLPPPMDIEAEASVLSAIMIDQRAIDSVVDMLEPEHFYSNAHRRIYEAMRALLTDGLPIDITTVLTRIRDMGRLSEVGAPYLTEILNDAPAVAHVRAYAQTVRDRWRLRMVAAECDRIRGMVFTRGYEEGIQKFIEDSAGSISRIAESFTTSTVAEGVTILKEIMTDVSAGKREHRTATGFTGIDALTEGFGEGELWVLGAATGNGKSAFAVSTAVNVAAAGDGVLIFSMEMKKKRVMNRAVAIVGDVPVWKTKGMQLSQAEWNRYAVAATQIGKWPLWVDDQTDLTLQSIRSKTRMVRAAMVRKKEPVQLRLVVVDYLQLVKGPSSAKNNRQEEVAAIARGLKNIAMSEGVAVLALSQINRTIEHRADKRPMMSDLRESGDIENAADNIAMLYREDYYAQKAWRGPGKFEPTGEAECALVKIRDGDGGRMVPLRFVGQFTRFENAKGDDE